MIKTPIFQISDSLIVSKLKEAAKCAGRADWKVYAQEIFDQALKMQLGMAPDMSLKEAASYLQIHKNSAANYLKRGLFPNAYWLSPRMVRIPAKDVLAVKNRTVGVTP